MKKIILASNSPRRKELLQGLGIPFDVFVLQGIDESYPADLPAGQVAEYISRKKAQAYLAHCKADKPYYDISSDKATPYILPFIGEECPSGQGGCLILTADTVVVCGGDILGKPHSEEEAVGMLRKLSGKTHQVYTGYCLTPLYGDESQQRSGTVCTDVTFKALSDEEITHYVTTFKPLDKAGAYGIQEWIGYIGITGIRGSYYNVMGLPVQRIYEELKKIG